MSRDPRQVLRQLGQKPKQSLGQNFCIDRSVLRRIAEAAKIGEGDTVIEIGPGTGALTEFLIETGASVTSVEIDQRFYEELEQRFSGASNFRLVRADALKQLDAVLDDVGVAVVVGNLPYHISSRLLMAMVANRKRVKRALVTLQLEVAQRMIAPPGNKQYGRLSARMQSVAEMDILFKIPPRAFFPAPKVDSALALVDFFGGPQTEFADETLFEAVIKAAFAQRRKQLRNSLRTLASPEILEQVFEQTGISGQTRPERLLYTDFLKLTDALLAQQQ